MTNFKIFAKMLVNGKFHRTPMSVTSFNEFLRSNGINYAFDSYDNIRNCIVKHFGNRFNERNKAYVSFADLWEVLMPECKDTKQFTHSLLTLTVYDF